MVYWIRNCFSQIEEEEDTKLKKEFWKALGVFIRLKIFPRIRQEKVNLLRDRLIEFWKNKKKLPPRVSGTLKPVEYAGKNRFAKYCRFIILNRPWSLVITHSYLTRTMICFRDSYAMDTFSRYFFSTKSSIRFPMRIISTTVDYFTGR